MRSADLVLGWPFTGAVVLNSETPSSSYMAPTNSDDGRRVSKEFDSYFITEGVHYEIKES